MSVVEIIFWSAFFIVFYTYIGYGIVLYLAVKIKRLLHKSKSQFPNDENFEPEVTLLIPAYNERDYVKEKMENCRALEYPKDKLNIVWVTDGSDDGTEELLSEYKDISVLHKSERNGKIAAMNRVMPLVKTPLVIFCDANTSLGLDAIKRIVTCFKDPKVGCVSGEKRIFNKDKDVAAGAGEGIYWRYESTLKKWDAELHSVVGAAGELFAIRTELFTEVEPDTLLDDFIISLRVAEQGYTIQYDPDAYAIESASANVGEELKRKVRISAGGIQSVLRLKSLLNIFKHPVLSFQYISHRVLRWTLTPICLLSLIPLLTILGYNYGFMNFGIYTILFWLQLLFYVIVFIGWILENKSIRYKVLFVPYYFFIMNWSVYLGFLRYLKQEQSVNWERAKRAA